MVASETRMTLYRKKISASSQFASKQILARSDISSGPDSDTFVIVENSSTAGWRQAKINRFTQVENLIFHK